jgi:hypothetical protein
MFLENFGTLPLLLRFQKTVLFIVNAVITTNLVILLVNL